jgi:hypothetical protein
VLAAELKKGVPKATKIKTIITKTRKKQEDERDHEGRGSRQGQTK